MNVLGIRECDAEIWLAIDVMIFISPKFMWGKTVISGQSNSFDTWKIVDPEDLLWKN